MALTGLCTGLFSLAHPDYMIHIKLSSATRLSESYSTSRRRARLPSPLLSAAGLAGRIKPPGLLGPELNDSLVDHEVAERHDFVHMEMESMLPFSEHREY